MSWFVLKKAKTIVYMPDENYGKFVNQYAELNHWSVSDKMNFYIAGTKRNKEKKRINKFIIDSMTNEWEHDKKGFREKYSFVYHADAIEEHLYELIWSFCQFNPHYQMLIANGGNAIRPTYVDVNLSMTFGKDFYVGECFKKNIAESQYRIKTETIKLIYGDMMDFCIGFENGSEYRFQTLFDGKRTSGSISIDMGDLPKWKILLEKAEEERLAREKAKAPARIITTDEFQRITIAFARDACEDFYEEMLEIEKDYEHYAMNPNVFVDFSVYEQKWSNLANRTKAKYDEVVDYDHLWDKQLNRDYSATGLYGVMLNQTRSFYNSIYQYAKDMAQMMHNLYEKAHGAKYSMKDYQKELENTERGRPSDYSYNDVKKRYLDLMNSHDHVSASSKPKSEFKLDLSRIRVGTKVNHNAFGEGVVKKVIENPVGQSYIHVLFGKRLKEFMIPDAFLKGYLTLK